MGSVARQLSDFIQGLSGDAFEPLARQRAVDAITDCVGCMLAGAGEPLAASLSRAIRTAGGSGSAVLAGQGACSSAIDAALFNGALAHALDYDDTNHPAYAHPSAVLVPALLAAAALDDFSGQALVTAYVIGFEVFGKLGRAMNTAHYRRGWHATATFGTLAATAAVARVLRLDPDQTVMALGIAASSAGGLRANFGSMVKPLHAGYAARNGLLAAVLAREGHDASEEALDHPYGYLNLFSGEGGFDPEPLRNWGQPLEILTPYGLALKPFPACGATHTAIEAALTLRARIEGRRPVRIEVGVSDLAFAPLIHVQPRRPLEGKFSMHYCVAAALVEGDVNLASFRQELIESSQIADLIAMTRMQVDPSVGDGAEFPTRLTIHTDDGERFSCFVPLAQGKPERWFTDDRIRRKFDDCLRNYRSSDAEVLFGSLRGMDQPDSLRRDSSWATRLRDCVWRSG
jgi:2-methylcitrate dehydratase PrpD